MGRPFPNSGIFTSPLKVIRVLNRIGLTFCNDNRMYLHNSRPSHLNWMQSLTVLLLSLIAIMSEIIVECTVYISITTIWYLKCICTSPQQKIDMWKGHILEVKCTNIQRKDSSSNEIIKFTNIWVFREDYCTPALFARDYRELFGYYLDSLLSDPLLWNVLFHYLMNLFLWMLVQWTSKLCSFHIIRKGGYGYTLIHTWCCK